MKTLMSWVALGLVALFCKAATLGPSETEAARELEKTRMLAVDYIKQLPDFLCTETIRRYIKLTLPKGWHPTDVLSVKLSYSAQNEDRQLVRYNGQTVDQTQESVGGMRNVGEFGGMLESVFDPATEAKFQWEGWQSVRGRPTELYSYQVQKDHSRYSLGFDPGGYVHALVVGYHGTVEIDRETGGVLRLVYEADGIPQDFPMQSAVTSVDYDFVEVAGRQYLLPIKSITQTESVDAPSGRNVAEFGDYRKYAADSTIRYDASEKQ